MQWYLYPSAENQVQCYNIVGRSLVLYCSMDGCIDAWMHAVAQLRTHGTGPAADMLLTWMCNSSLMVIIKLITFTLLRLCVINHFE